MQHFIGQTLTIPDVGDPPLPVTGIVNTLTLATDAVTKISTLTVNITDSLPVPPVTQDVVLDLAKALSLNLLIVDKAKIGTPVVIDPADILESTTFGKGINTLEKYFGTALGVTAEQLAAFKADGFGYGVIAQACWMATQLKGDEALLEQILMAKQSGDFSTIVLPDGKTATNWGQLRKAVLTGGKQNFGQIMSGHATPIVTATPTETPTVLMSTQGNGHGHGHGKGGNK